MNITKHNLIDGKIVWVYINNNYAKLCNMCIKKKFERITALIKLKRWGQTIDKTEKY